MGEVKNSNKLAYICNFGKNRATTWSGTTLSLENALKRYFTIIECNVAPSLIEKCLIKLSNARIAEGKIKFDRPLYCNILYEHVLSKRYLSFVRKLNEGKVFQIGCMGICDKPYYTYQDVCVDALLGVKEKKPDLYQYSTVENIPQELLIRKANFQKKIYNNAAGIFTMGKWLAEFMIHEMGIPEYKVHAVGGGTNIDSSKVDFCKKEGNKFLFVGRDFIRKGGDLVCKAFDILQREYMQNAILYVVGPSLKPKECDLNPQIKFMGDMDYMSLSNYFNMCDVFCMPSRYEAYGLVFIEALIYGLPCIARNAFEMKYFIQDGANGYLIDNDDPEKLANKMCDLICNSAITDYVRGQHEFYVDEYSWDSVAKRITEVMMNDGN